MRKVRELTFYESVYNLLRLKYTPLESSMKVNETKQIFYINLKFHADSENFARQNSSLIMYEISKQTPSDWKFKLEITVENSTYFFKGL